MVSLDEIKRIREEAQRLQTLLDEERGYLTRREVRERNRKIHDLFISARDKEFELRKNLSSRNS